MYTGMLVSLATCIGTQLYVKLVGWLNACSYSITVTSIRTSQSENFGVIDLENQADIITVTKLAYQ